MPLDWLTAQLGLTRAGIDAIAGTSEVHDWRDYPVGFAERFRQFYAAHGSHDRHGHVHGANLGVRGDAYLAVGGFAPLPSGEDHALWNALRTAGRAHVASHLVPVTTSVRRVARAPAGFSGFLRAFDHAA